MNVKSSSCYPLQPVGSHIPFIGQFTKFYVSCLIYGTRNTMNEQTDRQTIKSLKLGASFPSPPIFSWHVMFEPVVWCVLTL